MPPCDIGVIGLGPMGQGLALNLAEHGYRVAVFNRTDSGEEQVAPEFVATHCRGLDIRLTDALAELTAALKRPRKLLLMISAGAPVDELLARLLPLLEADDIIVDGGNSRFQDTARRQRHCEAAGVAYIGCGISGGVDGARRGPALMPGGSPRAWPQLREMLQAIAARADDGAPCCEWIGAGGAGHFVKLVHNGIEYAQMQLLAESYDFQKRLLGMSAADSAAVFSEWNRGPLRSYLMEITGRILACRDADGGVLVDPILDCAGQKGTGKELVGAALELGVAVPALTEAVNARLLSTLCEERQGMARGWPVAGCIPDLRAELLADLHEAVVCTTLGIVAQGEQLLRAASAGYGWDLDLQKIFQIWRAGCIIRADLLAALIPQLAADAPRPLLAAAPLAARLEKGEAGWRRTVQCAVEHRLPAPVLAATLSYYDGLCSAELPANLIQAQRDYFGAHRVERRDASRGEWFHVDWEAP